jgi:hypothetical protein
MHQLLVRLAALLPWRPASGPSGRHRAPRPPAPARTVDAAPAAPPAVAVVTPPDPVPLLRGEDTPLVRPYVLALERSREEARRQRARRRTLWFAVHGVDLGPRVIHGVEVAA